MNAKQAIELATEHFIPVTTDRKFYAKNSSRVVRVSFTVGKCIVDRPADSKLWNVNGGCVAYSRGEAIRLCVEDTLETRHA